MTDEFTEEKRDGQAEFYLATSRGGTVTGGLKIEIDGQDAPLTKGFKILHTGKSPPRSGERLLVMKLSGTYIILGKIDNPCSWWSFAPLASTATLADVISRINEIGRMFNDTGIAKNT